MGLRKYTNKELQEELENRQKNPTWFIRDLIEEGHDLDNEGFDQATAWMDDPHRNTEF